MTGGRRVVDTANQTILEKGWHSGQGLFGDRSLPANMVSGATPLTSTTPMLLRVNGMGFRMRFTLLSARNFTVRYWNNTNFSDPTARGDETNIPADKNWGNNAPTTNVNADNFGGVISEQALAEYAAANHVPILDYSTGQYKQRPQHFGRGDPVDVMEWVAAGVAAWMVDAGLEVAPPAPVDPAWPAMPADYDVNHNEVGEWNPPQPQEDEEDF